MVYYLKAMVTLHFYTGGEGRVKFCPHGLESFDASLDAYASKCDQTLYLVLLLQSSPSSSSSFSFSSDIYLGTI